MGGRFCKYLVSHTALFCNCFTTYKDVCEGSSSSEENSQFVGQLQIFTNHKSVKLFQIVGLDGGKLAQNYSWLCSPLQKDTTYNNEASSYHISSGNADSLCHLGSSDKQKLL